MPRVWADEPSARLVLCGRSPCSQVRALAGPGIEVTGTVPSVAPYLASAAVYANALFHGAGSSLKVPEALASGIPLVSTGLGVRGFPLVPQVHYTRAEDARSFASAIVQLLRARAELDDRARAARAVAEQFDWERVAEGFAELVACTAAGLPLGQTG
jgi:glycosyltransferase involved in cell wall biosynthesis